MKYSVTLKMTLAEIAEVAYTSFTDRGGHLPWSKLNEASQLRWLYVAESIVNKLGIEQSIIDAETP